MLRRSVLLAALAAGACTSSEPPPTLPASAGGPSVTTDPITAARLRATEFFRSPQAGQPAAAARAIADIEFLAAAVPNDPVWQTARSSALLGLAQSRNEARRALGIPGQANSQAVIDGLTAAATALDGSDRAGVGRALPRNVFTAGPEQTVRRLSAPPRVPSAGTALGALSLGPGGGGV